MLITFSIVNYRSFKDQADFTMLPARPKKENINIHKAIPSDGKPISVFTTSSIYGANGSGKTNLLKAMQVVSKLMNEHNLKPLIEPCLFDKESSTKPTEFMIDILAEDNVLYRYEFSATDELIHEERLFSYPKGRERMLYERTLVNSETKEYKYVNKLTGIRRAWQSMTRHDKLFLPVAIRLNNQQLLPVYNWFENNLVVAGIDKWSYRKSAKHCLSGGKQDIIDFLNKADMNIANIDVRKGGISPHIQKLLETMNPDDIDDEDFHDYSINLFYETKDGRIIDFDIDNESQGTNKMFALSYTILDVLKNGKVLFIDELDNSIHPLLVTHIINLFNDKDVNKNNAQLIFVTHDTTHFNQFDFQKDQIWMCDKNNKGESELYSLAEFKPRKDMKNFQGAYLFGRYGGIPILEDV